MGTSNAGGAPDERVSCGRVGVPHPKWGSGACSRDADSKVQLLRESERARADQETDVLLQVGADTYELAQQRFTAIEPAQPAAAGTGAAGSADAGPDAAASARVSSASPASRFAILLGDGSHGAEAAPPTRGRGVGVASSVGTFDGGTSHSAARVSSPTAPTPSTSVSSSRVRVPAPGTTLASAASTAAAGTVAVVVEDEPPVPPSYTSLLSWLWSE